MNHLHPKVTEIISPFPQGRIVLYLIRGERNAIIDTGTNITPEKDIAPILESMGLTLADIHLILNIHRAPATVAVSRPKLSGVPYGQTNCSHILLL